MGCRRSARARARWPRTCGGGSTASYASSLAVPRHPTTLKGGAIEAPDLPSAVGIAMSRHLRGLSVLVPTRPLKRNVFVVARPDRVKLPGVAAKRAHSGD